MHTFSKATRKMVLAVLVGPLSTVPAMLIAITVFVVVTRESQTDIFDMYRLGLLIAMYGIVISYIFTIVYGLPAYLVLIEFNKNNVYATALVSIIPTIVVAALNYNFGSWTFYLLMAYFSVSVSLAFWYIANRKTQVDIE
ncbi:MAG: hypothetical protein KAT25_07080 [Sulfuriflexus sp.]|nr:hypothetical protein [Sulfuriflexus sp.]